jgi:hypothetical protein
VTLEADYVVTARELLAGHLASSGLRARSGDDGVATGIGRIVIDFEIERISPEHGRVQMVFWARIDGVDGLPSPIDLDLLGLGQDAHEALQEGVHAVLDGVVPVLRFDREGGAAPEGVVVPELTSMTDGRPTAWLLALGPPSLGGEPRAELVKAVDDLMLMQGIVDSITPALSEIRPHWMKLFLVRAPNGSLTGDVKVDGVQIGVPESFESPSWPTSTSGLVVRQFGLARPSRKAVDQETVATLRGVAGAGAADQEPAEEPDRRRSWWRRLGR